MDGLVFPGSLIEEGRRQSYLLDRIITGIIVHDASTEIVYANAAAAALLGVTVDEIYGMDSSDPRWVFRHEDGSAFTISEYPVTRALVTRSVVKNVVGNIQRPNDEHAWILCNAYPVLDDSGGIAQVLTSFMDISDLKAAQLALAKSEERLKLVLRGSHDAPWDWDMTVEDGMHYSPRWWEMLGLADNELPPDPGLWNRLVHADDVARVDEHFARILASRETTYEIEFRLKHSDGHYVPVLSRGFVTRDGDGEPLRVSGTNMDLTERKDTEEQIYRLAFFDSLTGLPNRRLLTEQLRRALQASFRNGRQGALLFIDLDDFKMLNDTMGHDMGDRLLQQVALRLHGAVRESDTVARLGGDEFVVMLERLPGVLREAAVEAERIGEHLLSVLDRPYEIDGKDHRSTASIGVALFGDGSQGVDGLLKQADLAMYDAKSAGRDTVRNFDARMQIEVEERLEMENELRKAIELGQLEPYYQQQVDARGLVTGAELLVRWNHPVRGLVMPYAFIGVAEATGLIVTLGADVLRAACVRLAAWARDPQLKTLTLSVNVSVRQFREPEFVASVIAVIDETSADPARLKFEITESLLVENVGDVSAKMHALKALGIKFSLDDFGTGYSSLKYLQRLPLDELKIDRTFVADLLVDPSDSTITLAIIGLAEKLGLNVIAEGVETESHRQFLAANGCRAYQGYLFGRPVPVADFEAAARAASVGVPLAAGRDEAR